MKSRPKLKKGDIVILNSPSYDVKGCKAIVHKIYTEYGNLVVYDFEIITQGDKRFSHSYYRSQGRHHSLDDDHWIIIKRNFFEDNTLFKI